MRSSSSSARARRGPTAREIADAAGISVRSVYVHFDDLDDLFRAAADRHFEQMASLLEPVDATLLIAERIAASTDQRIQIHERFGAVRRAAEQWAPQSPALDDVLRQGRTVGRQDIERLFGLELVGYADHDATLSAITLLLGAEAWDSLRGQGLSVTAAPRGGRPFRDPPAGTPLMPTFRTRDGRFLGLPVVTTHRGPELATAGASCTAETAA